jgi:4a-hydroxytetrahydrobiopterin dehydratase
MTERISPRRYQGAGGVEDWQVVGDGACAYFRTGSFAAGARLVQAISELDGLDAHHPDVDLRYEGVTVRLFTIAPAPDGLSTRYVELARRISAAAHELGIRAYPSAVQNLVITIDALVIPAVLPFWRAVLGYESRADTPEEELTDPHRRGPVFYFNRMDAPRPWRNRIHIDVWAPHDGAEARVAAAIAAGGRVVTDRYAPGWWVLADAEGNEAWVATWLGGD